MITREKLLESGFTETSEKGLTFFTRDNYTIVCINGLWCPCVPDFRERLIGNTYITQMSELEKLINQTQEF